ATSIDRQRSLTNPSERDIRTIVYDDLLRPVSSTIASGGDAATTTFAYDGVANCGCVATPGSALVHKIVDPDNKVTYRYYDWLDRVTKIVRKVGDTADNGGDSTPIGPNNPTNRPHPITQIEYDNEGNVKAITGPSGERIEWLYDALGRRYQATAVGNSTTDNLVKTLGYDAAGNVKTVTQPNHNVVNITYDGLNRMQTIGDS